MMPKDDRVFSLLQQVPWTGFKSRPGFRKSRNGVLCHRCGIALPVLGSNVLLLAECRERSNLQVTAFADSQLQVKRMRTPHHLA
jgi:hypothetical protein